MDHFVKVIARTGVFVGLMIGGNDGARGEMITTVVAVTGEAAPDRDQPGGFNGLFGDLFPPIVGNGGHVVFSALVDSTVAAPDDNEGIFIFDGVSTAPIARKNQAVPVDDPGDKGGTFQTGGNTFFGRAVSRTGHVVFTAIVEDPLVDLNGLNNDGIYRARHAPDSLEPVAEAFDDAPGGGIFTREPQIPTAFSNPATNDAGVAAFGTFIQRPASFEFDDAIVRGDPNSLDLIVKKGQAAPDNNGTFLSLFDPDINASGEVLFGASLNTAGDPAIDEGIFLGDGTLESDGVTPVVVQMVREGQAAPDGNGVFGGRDSVGFNAFGGAQIGPTLNDRGEAAFLGFLTGTSDGDADDSGVFVSNGTTVTTIVREGDSSPDGNGTFADFDDTPLVFGLGFNDRGQVAFGARFDGTDPTTSLDDTGIYRGDGTTLKQIIRGNQPTPSGDGVFFSVDGREIAINDLGQLAFKVRLFGAANGPFTDGLFLFDDNLGIIEIVREGDKLLGSTIEDIRFAGGVERAQDDSSGLNNRGQVAYLAELADGRRAVVLFSVGVIPEPASLTLLALGSVTLLWRGRSRRGGRLS